ncbi:MAG: DUF1570 domain-containing protein [Planctomycetes bacterium]|nr:DUF1570 domain-containing protein [Planctomycetota bacterium]
MLRRYSRFVIPGFVVLVFAISIAILPWTSNSVRADDEKETKSSTGDKKSKKKKKSRKSSGKSDERSEKTSSKGSGSFEMKDVAPDEKAEKKVQKSLGENFKIKRTLHYSIFYDTSEEDVGVFGHAIERTYRSCGKYCKALGAPIEPPNKKMITHFFNEFEDYAKYSQGIRGGFKPSPEVLGFYTPETNYTYFYNFRNTPTFKSAREQAEKKLVDAGKARDAQGLREARWVINRTNSFGGGVTEETLQHEVAHQVLFNVGFHNMKSFGANPRWFAEGMAQLFEPVTTAKGGNMGIVNKEKASAFQNLLSSNRLYPVKEFIKDIRPFVSGDVGGLSYPQAWGLMHYINRVKRKELREYVAIINKRPRSTKPRRKRKSRRSKSALAKSTVNGKRNGRPG